MNTVKTATAQMFLAPVKNIDVLPWLIIFTTADNSTVEIDIDSVDMADKLIEQLQAMRNGMKAEIDGAMREFD